ncbi:hypothetical protein O9992_17185 [Vibrio lentus]|nr:hypothetical protein [Vibrio lentus]
MRSSAIPNLCGHVVMRLGLIQGSLNTKKVQPEASTVSRSSIRIRPTFHPQLAAENGMRQEMMLAGVISGTRMVSTGHCKSTL